MKYFAYKEDGEFNGFYCDNVHKQIPVQSIKITDKLWKELLKNNYKYKLNLFEDKLLDLQDKDIYFEQLDVFSSRYNGN